MEKFMKFYLIFAPIFIIGMEVFLYNIPNTATGYSLFEDTAMQRAKTKAEKDCPGYKWTALITNGYSAAMIYKCDQGK